mgnify:CR=1 FL=1
MSGLVIRSVDPKAWCLARSSDLARSWDWYWELKTRLVLKMGSHLVPLIRKVMNSETSWGFLNHLIHLKDSGLVHWRAKGEYSGQCLAPS